MQNFRQNLSRMNCSPIFGQVAGKFMLAIGAICFVSALVVAIFYALQTDEAESGKSKT